MKMQASSLVGTPGIWAVAALVLVALAGSSEAARKARPKDAKAAAPATAPATPPAVPVPLSAAEAKGTVTLQLALAGKMRLGGFALTATWDPAAYVIDEPKSDAALSGYLCQANVSVPGTLRYNCAGLPNEDRGGLLSTMVVRYRDKPPALSDFKVTQNEVVDDLGRTVAEKHVELALAAKAP